MLSKMHELNNFKIVNAQQARIIYSYKNTKEKLLKTNAVILYGSIICAGLTT
jgi:hypothetical protein